MSRAVRASPRQRRALHGGRSDIRRTTSRSPLACDAEAGRTPGLRIGDEPRYAASLTPCRGAARIKPRWRSPPGATPASPEIAREQTSRRSENPSRRAEGCDYAEPSFAEAATRRAHRGAIASSDGWVPEVLVFLYRGLGSGLDRAHQIAAGGLRERPYRFRAIRRRAGSRRLRSHGGERPTLFRWPDLASAARSVPVSALAALPRQRGQLANRLDDPRGLDRAVTEDDTVGAAGAGREPLDGIQREALAGGAFDE